MSASAAAVYKYSCGGAMRRDAMRDGKAAAVTAAAAAAAAAVVRVYFG